MPEIAAALRRSAARQGWSALDRALERKVSPERTVSEEQLTQWERARLQTLTQRGLAWPVPGGWQLSTRWEDLKMRDTEGPTRTPVVEHEEEQTKSKSDHTREAERAHDEQQRRITQINDLEQELGWER
jgi:hypothetical protein